MVVLMAVWSAEGLSGRGTHLAVCLCSTGTGGCCSRQRSEGDAAQDTSGMSKPAKLGQRAQGQQGVGRTSSAREQVSEPGTKP